MELKTAIEILEYHQEWRLGKREDMIHEPKKLTEALDMVLNEVKKYRLADVSGSLPSLNDAAKVAVRISEEAIKPPLDAKEQDMFIAGFQECIKWLNVVFSNDR